MQNNDWWLLPLFRQVLHTKLPVFFSEINPVPPYFPHLKSFPWKGHLTVKVEKKKIINQILSYGSFCFEIRAHLGHLFPQPPKIIKFNRWSCLKKWAKHKIKSYICCIVWVSFRARNAIKNETKKVNKTVSFAQFPWFFFILRP